MLEILRKLELIRIGLVKSETFDEFKDSISNSVGLSYIHEEWLIRMANSADYKAIGFSMIESLKRDKFENIKDEVRVEFIKKGYDSKRGQVNDDNLFKGNMNGFPDAIEKKFKKAFEDGKFAGSHFDGESWNDVRNNISRFIGNVHLKSSFHYFDKEVTNLEEQVFNAVKIVELISKGVVKPTEVIDINFSHTQHIPIKEVPDLHDAIKAWNIKNEYFNKIEGLVETYLELGKDVKESSNKIIQIILDYSNGKYIEHMEAYRLSLVRESKNISKEYAVLCRFLDLHIERTSLLLSCIEDVVKEY